MTRIGVAALLALALAGGARAATIPQAPTGLTPIASAKTPNAAGSLNLPPAWTSQARTTVELSYPELQALWQGAGAAYGIPWQVLGAINKIESNFGRNMGPSSAGAVGWMQFMPSTWLRWGYDFDQDGYADPWSPKDGIYSAARYLAAAGARTDLARGIFAYNHAQWYVDQVLDLSRTFKADPTIVFTIDALDIDLSRAERRVSRASERLTAAREGLRAATAKYEKLARTADATQLISERGKRLKRAAQAGQHVTALKHDVSNATSVLASAQEALASAREQALAASFNPTTAPMLGSPQFLDGWAFPVGGGPATVSVSHSHHDYPAADIAAPEGAPVYALNSGVVEKVWDGIDPLCGIGFTYRTDDGRVWAYCHLSYREPSVAIGARFAAGAAMGLVGSTGNSTGPHLHLGLRPASGYPQEEPWFERFAGLAFRWQDAITPLLIDSATQPQVFTIVDIGDGDGQAEQSAAPAQPAAAPSVSVGGQRAVFGGPLGQAIPVPQTGEDAVIEFTR